LERLPPEKIIEGAEGPSEKIRRLAAHGYTRKEIATFLGKRYQHVRNVMLTAGLTGGLDSDRSRIQPVEIEVEPIETIETYAPPSDIDTERLEKGGFYRGGDWLLENGALRFEGKVPIGFGVYVFVSLGDIVYVGVSTDLSRRMNDYKYGNKGQSTSRRVKGLIMENLELKMPVHVFFHQPGRIEIAGLPIEVSPGLETALIHSIQPEWNLKHVRAKNDEADN